MEKQLMETPSPVPTRKSLLGAALVELAQSLILGVLLAAALHMVIQPTVVYGQSMEPSLHQNERVIVDKVSYRIGEPSRGDIVVFPVEGEPLPLIKRVIGLPGETVQVRDGRVFVNGIVLREPYASGPTFENTKLVHVPTDTVFVMGDNRAPGGSLDSRRLGPIPLSKIMGRARVAIWPPSNWSILDSRGVK
jgi:signal peptidase I